MKEISRTRNTRTSLGYVTMFIKRHQKKHLKSQEEELLSLENQKVNPIWARERLLHKMNIHGYTQNQVGNFFEKMSKNCHPLCRHNVHHL